MKWRKIMANYCFQCACYGQDIWDIDKNHPCSLLNTNVRAIGCCPGWRPIEYTPEEKAAREAERERLLALGNRNNTAAPAAKQTTEVKQRKTSVKSVTEREEEIQVKLFDHQKNAREKFKDLNEIALFFEMGCGKTLTSMMIICDKYKAGLIDSLLVVAPNDVHKQWFDDLCDDESTLSIAIAQEGVECTGQIIGGRGGQKAFYEFDDEDEKLHIVCVNIDTFSTPHKWEEIVKWANS